MICLIRNLVVVRVHGNNVFFQLNKFLLNFLLYFLLAMCFISITFLQYVDVLLPALVISFLCFADSTT